MLKQLSTHKDFAAWDLEFWTLDPEHRMYLDSTYVTLLVPSHASYKEVWKAAEEYFQDQLIAAAEKGLDHEITIEKKQTHEDYGIYQ